MPEIGIISNPFAKMNRENPEYNQTLWYQTRQTCAFNLTSSLEELSSVCEDYAARNLAHIAIVGGDGTIGLTLQHISKAYKDKPLPKIILLRGGTMNVLAKNVGLSGSPKNEILKYLACLSQKKTLQTVKIDTLNVNGKLGFLFASGSAVTFLESFYKIKSNAIGAFKFLCKVALDGFTGGALNGSFREILNAHNLQISTNTSPNRQIQSSMVFASTIPLMPFGIKLFHKLTPGKGNLTIFESDSIKIIAEAAHKIAVTSTSELFEKCDIDQDPLKNYSLDGEILDSTTSKIHICIGPTFEICRPYGNINTT